MPVEPTVFQVNVAVLPNLILGHLAQDPGQDGHPRDNVEGVQSRHDEIEAKEDLFARGKRGQVGCVGVKAVMKLRRPLEGLDDEEEETQTEGHAQKPHHARLLAPLDRDDAQHHGKAAGEENEGVDDAERDVQLGPAEMELRRIAMAHVGVGDEEAAKKDHLGDEKEPHSQLGADIVAVSMPTHFSTSAKWYGPVVIVGISSKFSTGGGLGMVHSRVTPPQGLSPAFSPLKSA